MVIQADKLTRGSNDNTAEKERRTRKKQTTKENEKISYKTEESEYYSRIDIYISSKTKKKRRENAQIDHDVM